MDEVRYRTTRAKRVPREDGQTLQAVLDLLDRAILEYNGSFRRGHGADPDTRNSVIGPLRPAILLAADLYLWCEGVGHRPAPERVLRQLPPESKSVGRRREEGPEPGEVEKTAQTLWKARENVFWTSRHRFRGPFFPKSRETQERQSNDSAASLALSEFRDLGPQLIGEGWDQRFHTRTLRVALRLYLSRAARLIERSLGVDDLRDQVEDRLRALSSRSARPRRREVTRFRVALARWERVHAFDVDAFAQRWQGMVAARRELAKAAGALMSAYLRAQGIRPGVESSDRELRDLVDEALEARFGPEYERLYSHLELGYLDGYFCPMSEPYSRRAVDEVIAGTSLLLDAATGKAKVVGVRTGRRPGGRQ